jgi:hypothetical protein
MFIGKAVQLLTQPSLFIESGAVHAGEAVADGRALLYFLRFPSLGLSGFCRFGALGLGAGVTALSLSITI